MGKHFHREKESMIKSKFFKTNDHNKILNILKEIVYKIKYPTKNKGAELK